MYVCICMSSNLHYWVYGYILVKRPVIHITGYTDTYYSNAQYVWLLILIVSLLQSWTFPIEISNIIKHFTVPFIALTPPGASRYSMNDDVSCHVSHGAATWFRVPHQVTSCAPTSKWALPWLVVKGMRRRRASRHTYGDPFHSAWRETLTKPAENLHWKSIIYVPSRQSCLSEHFSYVKDRYGFSDNS